MMIESTIQRPPQAPAPMPLPQRQMSTVIVALGLMLIAAGYITENTPAQSHSENLVVRCDRISGQVGRSLVEQGIAANSAELRRQKQLAFRTCVDDYDAFKRLAGAE
jgi:hypothetical protein